MAGPIAHIFLALQALTFYLPHHSSKEFIIGTSFPDIRYLKVIDRTETHCPNVTWNMVVNEPNSFKAGMLFHALVDIVREDYMEERAIYSTIKKDRLVGHALKIVEDTLLREKIDTWDTLYSYFDAILPEERAFNIPEKQLKVWHAYIQEYCSYCSYTQTLKAFRQFMPFPAFYWNYRLKNKIQQIAKNNKVKATLLAFYDNALTLLVNH